MERRAVFKISVQCLIYKDERILLMKRSSNIAYGDMYCLPGGHLENNETVIDGMIRELKEEIGIIFEKNELELVKVINRKLNGENYLDFIYKGYLKNRKIINLEKDKCSKIIYRTIDKIPRNSIPVLKKIVADKEMYNFMEE